MDRGAWWATVHRVAKSWTQLCNFTFTFTLPTKVCLVKAMVFPVVMYGCENCTIKESWVLKNWCFWTVVLDKTLESPLDCKEIQPVHPKGDQSWIFIGRTDVEAETPILWSPDVKNWLIGKDPDAGKDWRGRQGWDGWMASLTQWTWVWASSRSWWRPGKPGMLQSMGLQRVRHDWATELNWFTTIHRYRKVSLPLKASVLCLFILYLLSSL